MAVIHISEADALRDFAALLDHVRAGSEVVIDGKLAPVAVIVPPLTETDTLQPEHDAWFRSQVQQALDDRSPRIPADEVEARFAQRRAASLLEISGTAE